MFLCHKKPSSFFNNRKYSWFWQVIFIWDILYLWTAKTWSNITSQKNFKKWNGLELNKSYQSSIYWEQKMAINCVRNTLALFFQHRKFHLTQKKKFSFSWYCMMEEQTHFISSIPRDGQQQLLTETGWRIYYNNWFQSSDGNSAVSWRRKTGALKKNSVRCTGIFLRSSLLRIVNGKQK